MRRSPSLQRSSIGVVSLPRLALSVLLACGGSSSETPPPLEPDPARLESGVDAETSPVPAPPPTSDEIIAPVPGPAPERRPVPELSPEPQ